MSFSQSFAQEVFLWGGKRVNIYRKTGATHMILLLHGCKQNPASIVNITRFHDLHRLHNFNLIVPEQSYYSNFDHCWNWFDPINQSRTSISETALLASLVQHLQRNYSIPAKNTWGVGLSAGAAEASNLMACWPELFNGFAFHSGLAYRVAESATEANDILLTPERADYRRMGKKLAECSTHALPEKILVFQGKKDLRVMPGHAQLIVQSFKTAVDVKDNMVEDNSRPFKMSVIRHPGQSKYAYDEFIHKTQGHTVKFYSIDQLAHAWSGGILDANNSDPYGPSASSIILSEMGF